MITGPNGTGKTSVLEALAYLGTRRSFRGAPPEAMVRTGTTSAIVRAEIDGADSPTLVEAEILPAGRSRTQGQPQVRERQEGAGAPPPRARSSPPRTSRSSAEDRRAAVTCSTTRWRCSTPRERGPPTRPTASCASAPRCCASRAGEHTGDVAATLDVWDQRLADAGKVLVAARERLVADLEHLVGAAYSRLAGAAGAASWSSTTSGAGTATSSTPCRQPRGRPAPRRQHGRTAPRRPVRCARRARGPHPRLPGRAALPRPGPAPRRAHAGPHPDPAGADPAPRRRVLRARPGTEQGPGGGAAGRPVDPHHGGTAARGASTWHGSCPSSPWRPVRDRRDNGPRRVGDSMPRLLGRLGASTDAGAWRPCSPAGRSWSGPSSAVHLRPVRVDGRALVVAVDHPGLGHPGPHGVGPDPGPAAGARARPASSVSRWLSSVPDGVVRRWPRPFMSAELDVSRVEWCVRIERPEVHRSGIRYAPRRPLF